MYTSIAILLFVNLFCGVAFGVWVDESAAGLWMFLICWVIEISALLNKEGL